LAETTDLIHDLHFSTGLPKKGQLPKPHTSLDYNISMFMFIKQKIKSTQMTYYFHRDSEVCIWWTLTYKMILVHHMTMTAWKLHH